MAQFIRAIQNMGIRTFAQILAVIYVSKVLGITAIGKRPVR